MGAVKNGCGLWDSKIYCISRSNRWIELIFACSYKFRNAKYYFINFWVFIVKSGCGLLYHMNLKSALSRIFELSWLQIFTLLAVTNSGKLKITIYWLGLAEYRCGLLDYGALKSALSQEWFNELSWLFACWCKFRKARSYFHNYCVGLTF